MFAGLHVGVVHSDSHFGYQHVVLFLLVPLVVSSGHTLSLIAVADAHVVFPAAGLGVPFHGVSFNFTLLVIILVIVLHVVQQGVAFVLIHGLGSGYAVYFFRIVNEVVLILGKSIHATYHNN